MYLRTGSSPANVLANYEKQGISPKIEIFYNLILDWIRLTLLSKDLGRAKDKSFVAPTVGVTRFWGEIRVFQVGDLGTGARNPSQK